jgi:hypothetical protein
MPADLHLHVVDEKGHEVPTTSLMGDWFVLPWDVTVPPDGEIEFTIGRWERPFPDYRKHTDDEMLIFGNEPTWIIPHDGRKLFLLGTLRESPPHLSDPPVHPYAIPLAEWTGSVDIPKIRLPSR